MRREVERIAAHFEANAREFMVVANPDHPFLYRNPDILVAHADNLAAIFVPDARERQNPDILLARYIAARLALPSTAKFVAVAPTRTSSNIRLREAFTHFDFHTTPDDLNGLSRLLLHEFEYMRGQVDDLSAQRRDELSIVSQACFEISEHQLDNQQSGEVALIADQILSSSSFAPASIVSWTAQRTDEMGKGRIRFRSLYSLEDERFAVSWQMFRRTNRQVAGLREHCTRALQYVFSIDNGVPYPRPVQSSRVRNARAHCTFLLVDEIPIRSLDPLWSIRALSFSRVCVLKATELKDIWNARDQIIERTEAIANGEL